MTTGPSHRAPGLPTLAVLALLPIVLTWPLARVFLTQVVAAPDQEAAPHIWGLWAAGRTGQALTLSTDLQAFPEGIELILVDPFNLPLFHLGALMGPAAGYNLLLFTGVVMMGVAGALLATEWDAPPWLGAVAAMACPTLLANAADGMTEGFGVGLVGIFAALMLRAARTGSSRAWLAAAVVLGLTPWAGPYNAVWAGLLGMGFAAAGLVRRRTDLLFRTIGVGLGGALLGLPVGLAIFRSRSDALPGGSDRAGLPEIVDNPAIFRGGVRTGADLLDPFLPVQLTGGEAPVSHTAYQGIVVLLCAIWVARSHRSARAWLLGAVGFIVLSFGPWLYWGGSVLRLSGAPLAAPAGLAILAVPVLGRLTRWYRAGAVATLLLAPLAARAGRTPHIQVGIALAICLDVLVCAPLAWPLHHSALPDVTALQHLPEPGALLELPPVTSGEPPPGRWRDLTAIAQVLHGRPVGGAMMGLGVSTRARSGTDAMRALMRSGRLDPTDHTRLREAGFRYGVVHRNHFQLPDGARQRLTDCFGPPVLESPALLVHDLGPADTPAGCFSSQPLDTPGFDSLDGAH